MRSKKENVTDETIERKATATAAGETEASAAATQKHMKGLQQTCNGEEEVMQTMQEDEEEKAKNSSSFPWSQLEQEQQMKRKRFQRNHDTTRTNNDVKKTKK